MTNTIRKSLPFILCFAGYLAVLLLAPRLSPVANWDYRLDREQATTRAREVASDFGFETTNWKAYVTSKRAESAYLASYSAPDGAIAATPARVSVLFVAPDSARKLNVQLNAQGAALGIITPDAKSINRNADDFADGFNEGFNDAQKSRARSSPSQNAGIKIEMSSDKVAVEQGENFSATDDKSSNQTNAPVDSAARAIADAALGKLVGAADAGEYRFVSAVKQGVDGKEGVRLTWERNFAAPEVKMLATVKLHDTTLDEISVTPDYSAAFREQRDGHNRATSIYGSIAGLFIALAVLCYIALLLLGILRRELKFRLPLLLLGIVFVIFVLHNLFGTTFDESFIGQMRSDSPVAAGFVRLLQLFAQPFFYALGLALLLCVGYIYVRRHQRLKFASFVALLRGKLTTAFVARSVWQGIAFGGLILGVQYLVHWSGVFGFTRTSADVEMLVARAPALTTLFQAPDYPLFTLYAFLLPALLEFLPVKRLTRLIVWLVGSFWITASIAFTGGYGTILVSAAIILILDRIYHRYDFLTVIIAFIAAAITHDAALMLAVDAPALNASGWRVLLALIAVLAVSFVISIRGKAAEIEDEIAPDTRQRERLMQAERDRLVAEFDVAHKAQQRMLPLEPPQIPGFEISAVCNPAREVGGDLYDFIRLPNERIGIVVADVSGKGVPAALYMTLTKGLLASIAQNESDACVILKEVNRHLYQVCRRKVFVTLVLGVLEPATKQLTYARAGHNPPVWRNADANENRLLLAPGLGLGLNKGKLFDSCLKPETITLNNGDTIVFYSDGITEAMNIKKDEFGEDRLMDVIERSDNLNATQTQEAIMETVGEFLGDVHPQDDQTVVVLRVTDDIVRFDSSVEMYNDDDAV